MNVIKIAICDDEEKAVALHEKIVKTCLQSQGVGYEITTYTQSRNLLSDITDDGFFYDLILLDIEMPGISGMEIPQQIKGFLPNVRIIFVTSHTEYAIDAFELSIFRYVPKNNLEVKLTAAVTDASIGTAKARKSLQQVFDELNTPEFLFIDRGCIVNIIQIMKVSDGMAVLKNGEQLPISRSHLQEVKQKINQFWGAHI